MNKAEIDNIGKLFHELWKKQPADRKPAAVGFRFGSEEYQAKRENCMAKDAFCFSGSKHKVSHAYLQTFPTFLSTSPYQELSLLPGNNPYPSLSSCND